MRKLFSCAFGAIAISIVLCTAARADWSPGQFAKYVQLPDLQTGLDVRDTSPKILADDFLCTSQDPINDVHIWGSWLNNVLPFGDPSKVQFKLSIHDDVRPGTGPSFPGALRYSTIVRPTLVRPYASATEQFYDPNINQIIGTDNQVFEYNFLNLPNPFVQEGTAAAPKIYWLDVQALPDDSAAMFGWKTSLQGFSIPGTQLHDDDAVFNDVPFPNEPTGPWTDMHYPSGTPLAGQSINQAFVITPEPVALPLSFLARRR
jgi:hypothetical protein